MHLFSMLARLQVSGAFVLGIHLLLILELLAVHAVPGK
jgi:hypothetical protein